MNNLPLNALIAVMKTNEIKDAMYALRNTHEQHDTDAFDALADEIEKRLGSDALDTFIDWINFQS